MSGRLYIHIGLAKAGSTAIQCFLNDNRAALAEHHVRVWRGIGVQHALAHKWGGGWQKPLPAGNYDKLWRDLRAEVGEKTDNTFVVSSERFTAATFEASGVPDFIANLFDGVDVRIILYLRPQVELAEAEYKQRVYRGLQLDFDEFISCLPQYFDFERLIAKWTTVFGTGHVIVRRYKREGLLQDFMEVLEIPHSLHLAPERRINTSISATTARLIRELGLDNSKPADREQIDQLRSMHDADGSQFLTERHKQIITERYPVALLDRVAP